MEQLFYLGFAVFPGIGPAKFQLLLSSFETAENAWDASVEDLTEVIGEKLAEELGDFRKRFAPQKYAKELEEKGIGWVSLIDEVYPRLLKKIKNPPFVIFYKGDPSLLGAEKTIGIVGTRSISQYGREVTEMLTRELVAQDFVIVSGLALGVDGVAHETCLESGGKTIAVLGSGVDICTPANHQKLYDRILAHDGLIVSILPPGEQPNKGSFPARNKIIAGLSLGVIVTEGTVDSGALYTADFARDMGRPVFSVPGPITSRLSAATSGLLKKGAIPVTSAEDVVDSLGIIALDKALTVKREALRGDTFEEQEILDLLQNEPLHFNEIVRKIGKDSKAIGSLLTLMELKGFVKSLGDGKYCV